MRRVLRSFRGLRSDRGAALVEFALVVPLLMMMMCATIDFGLAVYTLNNLTAAAREGGRYAATLDKAAWADVTTNGAQFKARDRVYKYIVGMNNGLDSTQTMAKIFVSKDVSDIITVEIRAYPYRPVTPLSTLLGLATVSLNRKAIFRWEMASS
jgi:Flp pilus assembly protein TadG